MSLEGGGLRLEPLEARERQIITPGTEILNGVLLTRAGIVVDINENPGQYQTALEMVDAELDARGPDSIYGVLSVVERMSAAIVPYDTDEYRLLLSQEAERQGVRHLTPEHQIALSKFMFVGGICHQQALVEGALLRLMQQRGDIGGAVSIESSPFLRPDHPDRHTKTVFTEGDRKYTLIGGGMGVW